MNSELKREIIFDNYKEPTNRGLVEDSSYLKTNTHSDSCIDNLDFMMKIEDNIIKDIVFDGEACAISTSATSIMIRSLIGKGVDEALKIIKNFQNMIEEKDYDKDLLGELIVYEDIAKQPNRKTCALLPSNAVINMISKYLENK